MDNEAIRQVVHDMTAQIVKEVNPSSIIDKLLSKNVITDDDYDDLCEVQNNKKRCRQLLSRLYRSTHPESFVQFRLALSEHYHWIVDEVDKQLELLTKQQPKKLHKGSSAKSKYLLPGNNAVQIVTY